MKFGFATDCSRPVEEIAREMKYAEDLDFDYAWLADVGLNRDVYIALAACATKTSSIQLGTSVTNPYTRHPAVAAAAFATIDEISNGRAVIGIGIGSRKNLLQPLGIIRKDTGPTCREAVEVMRGILGGRSSSFHGRFFGLRNARLEFKPNRKIPIYLAGRGRGTLAVAGEIADGVMFSSLATPRAVKYAINAIAEGAKSAGRDLSSVEKALFVRVCMSKDGDKAKEAVRPFVPYRLWDDSHDTIRQLGYDEERVRKIKNAYGEGDLSKAGSLITDQMLEDFALAGTVNDCVEKIEKLRTFGVTQIIVLPVPIESTEKNLLLKQFSEQIAARFK